MCWDSWTKAWQIFICEANGHLNQDHILYFRGEDEIFAVSWLEFPLQVTEREWSSRHLSGVAGVAGLFGVQEIRVGVRELDPAPQLPGVVPTMRRPPPGVQGPAGAWGAERGKYGAGLQGRGQERMALCQLDLNSIGTEL